MAGATRPTPAAVSLAKVAAAPSGSAEHAILQKLRGWGRGGGGEWLVAGATRPTPAAVSLVISMPHSSSSVVS